MAAPMKYSDELRERATRMALEAIAAEGQRMGPIRRIADHLVFIRTVAHPVAGCRGNFDE
ncbi:hypothetical protein [Streptomonospora alba]|uniref:hypothetical protein n=1 Tax=Streptomonospora alba TaxID=183763 RepID=UPI0012EEB23F|nr:hypothetical protein [Streptomonospora alba]